MTKCGHFLTKKLFIRKRLNLENINLPSSSSSLNTEATFLRLSAGCWTAGELLPELFFVSSPKFQKLAWENGKFQWWTFLGGWETPKRLAFGQISEFGPKKKSLISETFDAVGFSFSVSATHLVLYYTTSTLSRVTVHQKIRVKFEKRQTWEANGRAG